MIATTQRNVRITMQKVPQRTTSALAKIAGSACAAVLS
jgi:hypothetical protein